MSASWILTAPNDTSIIFYNPRKSFLLHVDQICCLAKNREGEPGILRWERLVFTQSRELIPGTVCRSQTALSVCPTEVSLLSYWKLPQLLGHDVKNGDLEIFISISLPRISEGLTGSHLQVWIHMSALGTQSYTDISRSRCLTKCGPEMKTLSQKGSVLRAWDQPGRERDGKGD